MCDPDSDGADLEMCFVANMALLNYFEGLIDTLEAPFLHNVTTQEHILPISLESDDFDKELLAAPETLRELVENYKKKKLKGGSKTLVKNMVYKYTSKEVKP